MCVCVVMNEDFTKLYICKVFDHWQLYLGVLTVAAIRLDTIRLLIQCVCVQQQSTTTTHILLVCSSCQPCFPVVCIFFTKLNFSCSPYGHRNDRQIFKGHFYFNFYIFRVLKKMFLYELTFFLIKTHFFKEGGLFLISFFLNVHLCTPIFQKSLYIVFFCWHLTFDKTIFF